MTTSRLIRHWRIQWSKARNEAEKIQETGSAAALVVSRVEKLMSRFVRIRVPDLAVLSYTEIPDDQHIQVQSSIGGEAAIEGETE